MATHQKPVSMFISYAQQDKQLLVQLETHLSLLKRERLISVWDAGLVVPGTNRITKTEEQLEHSSIVLLLVSANFFSSDYCDAEMKRALQRHEAGQALVIPIIACPCDLSNAPFEHIQALPTDARPITTWSDENEAWTNVTQGIRRAVGDLTLLSDYTSRADLRRVILAELADSDEDVRFAAARTLVALKDPDTVRIIISRLDIEPEPLIRFWLVSALGQIGGELCLNALQNAKAREVDLFVQQAINKSLESI